MTYDPDNIFAKILSGEFPSHKVYEDDAVIAILDIMPQAPGHTLVIPKAPSENFLDADPTALQQVMPALQKVAKAVETAFDADGVHIQQFNGAAAGQTVFHLHFHVIPRHEGVSAKPHASKPEDPDILAGHTEKLKAVLSSS